MWKLMEKHQISPVIPTIKNNPRYNLGFLFCGRKLEEKRDKLQKLFFVFVH